MPTTCFSIWQLWVKSKRMRQISYKMVQKSHVSDILQCPSFFSDKSPNKRAQNKTVYGQKKCIEDQRWAIPTPESQSSLEPTPFFALLESESESESESSIFWQLESESESESRCWSGVGVGTDRSRPSL